MTNKNEIKLFQNRQIRTKWDSKIEDYYFSVIDVIAVLTESKNPSQYWRTLKSRLKEEGGESVTNCNRLKMPAADGNINAIDYDKQVVGRTSGIVISVSGFKPIVLQGATDENFQLLNDAWLNFNKKSNESVQKIVETNTLTNADELLKYAELYEKGLLTDEEFAAMKKKIIEK